jgi:hypothetical protein
MHITYVTGAVGSDDEAAEEERSYRAHASCAYVRAFEAEPEEDEFDRQAAGGISSIRAAEAKGEAGAAAAVDGDGGGSAWRRQMRHMEVRCSTRLATAAAAAHVLLQ